MSKREFIKYVKDVEVPIGISRVDGRNLKMKTIENSKIKDLVADKITAGTLTGINSVIGSGNDIFKADSNGIYLGNVNFNDAPFKVDMDGFLWVKHLSFLRTWLYTFFESLDGWYTQEVIGSGVITLRLGSLYLCTGATINSKVRIFNNELSAGGITSGTNSVFETSFEVQSLAQSAAEIIAGVGDAGTFWGEDDGTASAYGFKVVNGVLKAFSCKNDGTNKLETTQDISGVTLTSFNNYRAVYIANTKVDYYVNGELKATITTNLPIENLDCNFIFGITNTEASNKEFYTNYGLFSQD